MDTTEEESDYLFSESWYQYHSVNEWLEYKKELQDQIDQKSWKLKFQWDKSDLSTIKFKDTRESDYGENWGLYSSIGAFIFSGFVFLGRVMMPWFYPDIDLSWLAQNPSTEADNYFAGSLYLVMLIMWILSIPLFGLLALFSFLVMLNELSISRQPFYDAFEFDQEGVRLWSRDGKSVRTEALWVDVEEVKIELLPARPNHIENDIRLHIMRKDGYSFAVDVSKQAQTSIASDRVFHYRVTHKILFFSGFVDDIDETEEESPAVEKVDVQKLSDGDYYCRFCRIKVDQGETICPKCGHRTVVKGGKKESIKEIPATESETANVRRSEGP